MSLEQRLERLERENRWMRRIGAVAIAVAAAVFLIGQGRALPDLEVRSLTMKDGDGKVRALLRIKDNQSPALVFFDSQSQRRAGLGVGPGDAPALILFDSHGNGRTSLLIDTDGTQGLRFMDPNKRQNRAVLCTGAEGGSSLTFFDGESNYQVVVGAITDVNKSTGVRTTTAQNALTLFDAKGNVIWQAPR